MARIPKSIAEELVRAFIYTDWVILRNNLIMMNASNEEIAKIRKEFFENRGIKVHEIDAQNIK